MTGGNIKVVVRVRPFNSRGTFCLSPRDTCMRLCGYSELTLLCGRPVMRDI